MICNFDYNQALEYILKKATSIGMNKSQLIEGICDYSNFSKMCNGKRKPNYDLILQLSQKLNISLNELQIHSSLKNPEEYLKLHKQFHEFRATRNYHEIKKLYISYQSQEIDSDINVQFILLWMQGIYEANQNQNYMYAIDLFSKAINLLQPMFSIKQPNLTLLTIEQLDLVHDICLCYMNLEKYSQAILIYKQLIAYLEDHILLDDFSLIPNYCYSLGSILLKTKEYECSKFYSLKGVEYCNKHFNLTKLPFLYCNLAIYEQVSNNSAQATQYLMDALFLFKMQNRPPSFYKGLNEFIKKYNFHIDLNNLQLEF